MDPFVVEIANDLANEYGRMLDMFRPAKPGSEYLEQNLIHLFGHLYLARVADGAFFCEVPFQDETGSHWSRRVDGFAFNKSLGYLIEAKGVSESVSNFTKISQDIDRLCSAKLEQSINVMFEKRNHQPPEKLVRIVVADCWHKRAAEHWTQNPESIIANCKTKGLSLETESFSIGNYGRFNYSLLVGQVEEVAE